MINEIKMQCDRCGKTLGTGIHTCTPIEIIGVDIGVPGGDYSVKTIMEVKGGITTIKSIEIRTITSPVYPLILKTPSTVITIETSMRCYVGSYGEKDRVVAYSIEEAMNYLNKMCGCDSSIDMRKECDYFEKVRVEKDPNPTFCREYKDGLPLVPIYEILASRPEGEIGILATTA